MTIQANTAKQPAKPDMRRILRAARLCEELGHGGDTLAALQHMQRMERALKVLHTWAAFPPVDPQEVRKVCAAALRA